MDDLTSLREKTVLARVSGNAYGMTRVDRLVRARAVQDGALPEGVTVKVMPAPEFAEAHAELVAVQYAARNALRNMSMPFGEEEGWRILPHSLLTQFLQTFAEHKTRFNTLLSVLKIKVTTPMLTLGKDGSEPAEATPEADAKAQELTDAYTLTWRVQDYPAAAFAGMPENTAQKLRQRHEAEMARVVAATRLQPVLALSGPVLHMIERLKALELAESGANKRVSLRSSMVENVARSVQLATAFNIFEDKQVDVAIDSVKPLADCDVGMLRSDAVYRGNTLQLANDVARLLESNSRDPLLTLAG